MREFRQDAPDKAGPVILRARQFNAGDKSVIDDEPKAGNLNFQTHKFTDRSRPDKKDAVVVSCFSEFGCEVLGCNYCIPKIKNYHPGKYVIAVGWYGRAYLYKHLVDEFWELGEEHQYLREYCRAFHHESKNLEKLENSLEKYGTVIRSHEMGKIVLGTRCSSCNAVWLEGKVPSNSNQCPYCHNATIEKPLFDDLKETKKTCVRIPVPSEEMLKEADKYLGPNPVGVFGRGRKCYGRNLPKEFYVKLLNDLKDQGYTPIWLGEKQSTIPCPLDDVVDFSRMPESRNLELTLAIVSKLKFTIQFWTASTRLAGMMGTPYLVFESPDQVAGNGQEGIRLYLTTFGNSKIVYSHYLNVLEHQDEAIELVNKSISEMNAGNWNEMIGMVGEPGIVQTMMNSAKHRSVSA